MHIFRRKNEIDHHRKDVRDDPKYQAGVAVRTAGFTPTVLGKDRALQIAKAVQRTRPHDAQSATGAQTPLAQRHPKVGPPKSTRAESKARENRRNADSKMVELLGAIMAGDDEAIAEHSGEFSKHMAKVVDPRSDRYADEVEDSADLNVEELDYQELAALKAGLAKINGMDQAQYAIAKAVEREWSRRTPDTAHAQKAARHLIDGNVTEGLKELKAARGDRVGDVLMMKEALADMKLSQFDLEKLLLQLEKGPAHQMRWSLAEVGRQTGKEHPSFTLAGNDLNALRVAARELLGKKDDFYKSKTDHPHEISKEKSVRDALSDVYGVEVSDKGKATVKKGVAGRTMQAQVQRELRGLNLPQVDNWADAQDQVAPKVIAGVRDGIEKTLDSENTPIRHDGKPVKLLGCNGDPTFTAPTEDKDEKGNPTGTRTMACTYKYSGAKQCSSIAGGAPTDLDDGTATFTFDLVIARNGDVKLKGKVNFEFELKPKGLAPPHLAGTPAAASATPAASAAQPASVPAAGSPPANGAVRNAERAVAVAEAAVDQAENARTAAKAKAKEARELRFNGNVNDNNGGKTFTDPKRHEEFKKARDAHRADFAKVRLELIKDADEHLATAAATLKTAEDALTTAREQLRLAQQPPQPAPIPASPPKPIAAPAVDPQLLGKQLGLQVDSGKLSSSTLNAVASGNSGQLVLEGRLDMLTTQSHALAALHMTKDSALLKPQAPGGALAPVQAALQGLAVVISERPAMLNESLSNCGKSANKVNERTKSLATAKTAHEAAEEASKLAKERAGAAANAVEAARRVFEQATAYKATLAGGPGGAGGAGQAAADKFLADSQAAWQRAVDEASKAEAAQGNAQASVTETFDEVIEAASNLENAQSKLGKQLEELHLLEKEMVTLVDNAIEHLKTLSSTPVQPSLAREIALAKTLLPHLEAYRAAWTGQPATAGSAQPSTPFSNLSEFAGRAANDPTLAMALFNSGLQGVEG
jgi:hypothetical protein